MGFSFCDVNFETQKCPSVYLSIKQAHVVQCVEVLFQQSQAGCVQRLLVQLQDGYSHPEQETVDRGVLEKHRDMYNNNVSSIYLGVGFKIYRIYDVGLQLTDRSNGCNLVRHMTIASIKVRSLKDSSAWTTNQNNQLILKI